MRDDPHIVRVEPLPAETPAARAAIPRALDYGRGRQPWRLRPRHVAVAVALAGCVAGSWTVGREARARTQNVLYARQAARHVEPAETVVFEPDPIRAASLISAGTHDALTFPGATGVGLAPMPAARAEPDSFSVFRDALARRELRVAGALIFLHELTTPGGVRRVVAVHFLPQYLAGEDVGGGPGLVARVFEPGGLISAPRYVGEAEARMLSPALHDQPAAPPTHDPAGEMLTLASLDPLANMGLMPPEGRPLCTTGLGPLPRWFAGQPDADDASHFTINYEIDGVPGTVDGYLSDDGRSVRMQARANPAPGAASPLAPASYSGGFW